eukprot:m.107507 g.107507  ORF g.107507 m.107507 type:complete len:354 (+) comp21156_c0_seq1:391-1452(+)
MGKKKGGKKSGKKKGAGADDASVIKVFESGYTRRCAEREGQAPIEEVAAGIKTAVKAGAEYTQMLLVPPIDLVGPLTSSRLDPLFDAVVQTGYKALRQLFLWNVVVRNADVLVLGRYLENPATTVDEVEFMHNELTRFAFERIGESLSFNKVVKKLSILHNDAEDEGATALCKGLAFNNVIEELHLEFCAIEMEGAESLGKFLASNNSVTELYLGGNRVGGGGAVHLARGLAVNRSLKRLDLADNNIDCFGSEEEDCCVFIEALGQHTATNGVFTYLDLWDNVIENRGGEAVLQLYERRKEAGAPTINIRVAPQMRKEVYDGITKGTKWVAGGSKSKGGKKKSGKKGGKKKKK